MAKMFNSKRGMSLAELMMVIAIGAIITVAVVAFLISLYNSMTWDLLE